MENDKYLFIFWRETENGLVLDKIVFWNMPTQDILEARKVWRKTIDCLNKDDLGNLPKIKDNRVCMRPKPEIVKILLLQPWYKNGEKYFWINASYIRDSIYNN